MKIITILGCIILGIACLIIAADPRTWWWKMNAKAFRYPKANEPSDQGYRGRRSGMIFSALCFFAVAAMAGFGAD